MIIALIVILVIIILLALWVMGLYNGLVRKRNQKDEAWSGISVQLKRRYDLIPNLVNTVKGYAAHEKETMTSVMQARASGMGGAALSGAISQVAADTESAKEALGTGDVTQAAQAEGILMRSLHGLYAVAEAYPDLKANEMFTNLSGQLSSLEDEIQMSRRYYNGTVRELNVSVESFPANLIAGSFGFQKAAFFELENPEEGKAPKVTF